MKVQACGHVKVLEIMPKGKYESAMGEYRTHAAFKLERAS